MDSFGNINWGSSDVCVTLFCHCGKDGYYEGEYFLGYECSCGKKYSALQKFELIEISKDDKDFNECYFKLSDDA